MSVRKLRALPVAGVVAVLGLAASGASGQAPPPVFTSGVEVVRLDVIVLDRAGHPVTGLTAADFAVEEDGREQSISSFEPVRVEAAEPPALLEPPRTTANRPRDPADGRCFFLFVDDVHLTPPVAERVRVTLRHFLDEQVREGDWVTLMAPERQLWWTARNRWEVGELRKVVDALKGQLVRDPFSDGVSDWQAVCMDEYQDSALCNVGPAGGAAPAAVRRETFKPHGDTGSLIGQGAGSLGPLGASELSDAAKRRVSVSLDGLRQALDALIPLRGHKSVVLFTEGFILLPRMQGYRDLIDAARRANVAVHFLDPRGLESGYSAEFQDAPSTFFRTERELNAAGSGDLADATGGHTFAGNDAAAALRQVAAESEAYYLLGYSPESPRTGERKVRVRTKRDGLTVLARQRYYVERPEEAAKAAAKRKKQAERTGFEADAVAAMRAVSDATDLPLRAATLFFDGDPKGEVATLLAVEVTPGAGRGAFKVAAEARRADGGAPVQEQFEESVEVRPGAPVVLARQWRLPPAIWQVRVVVQERPTGRVGSAIHTFEVPDARELRLSTPLLTTELERTAEGLRPRVALGRTYAATGLLYCQFSVYGAAGRPAEPPRVSSWWELRRGGGLVRGSPPTAIAPTPAGRLTRTVGVSLDGAGPGEYSLTLGVRDEGSGRTLTRTEEFSLVAGVRSDQGGGRR